MSRDTLCCARLHRKSIWNSRRGHNGAVPDFNDWAFRSCCFKVELGTDFQSDFPRTGCVLLRNVGRTLKLMIWWSWLHCQDCRSDVSGSDLVEFKSKDAVDSNTKLSGKNLDILSRRNRRAPFACHGWSRIFFKIAEGDLGMDLLKQNWVPTSWSIKATGRALSWGWIDLERNQEVMLFVLGYFLCRRWILVRWILRAQRFGGNVVWNGLSRAGGAHKKLRVVESEVGEDQKMFSDGS